MTARPIRNGLLLAGALLATAALLKAAEHAHFVAPETAVRGGQCAIGLSLAFFANTMPKKFAVGRMQTALRVGGWCLTLAGLAYALLSVFAPQNIADTLSMAIVAAATAVTLGLTLWVCTGSRAASTTD